MSLALQLLRDLRARRSVPVAAREEVVPILCPYFVGTAVAGGCGRCHDPYRDHIPRALALPQQARARVRDDDQDYDSVDPLEPVRVGVLDPEDPQFPSEKRPRVSAVCPESGPE